MVLWVRYRLGVSRVPLQGTLGMEGHSVYNMSNWLPGGPPVPVSVGPSLLLNARARSSSSSARLCLQALYILAGDLCVATVAPVFADGGVAGTPQGEEPTATEAEHDTASDSAQAQGPHARSTPTPQLRLRVAASKWDRARARAKWD